MNLHCDCLQTVRLLKTAFKAGKTDCGRSLADRLAYVYIDIILRPAVAFAFAQTAEKPEIWWHKEFSVAPGGGGDGGGDGGGAGDGGK